MSNALEEGGKDIGNVRRVVDGGNKLKEGFWEMQVRTKNQLNRKGRDVISIPFIFSFFSVIARKVIDAIYFP